MKVYYVIHSTTIKPDVSNIQIEDLDNIKNEFLNKPEIKSLISDLISSGKKIAYMKIENVNIGIGINLHNYSFQNIAKLFRQKYYRFHFRYIVKLCQDYKLDENNPDHGYFTNPTNYQHVFNKDVLINDDELYLQDDLINLDSNVIEYCRKSWLNYL